MSEMSKSQMLIGGEWLPPASKDYFESFNPYTGKPWKLIARGDAEDADRAVEAAYQAFHNPDWRNLTATARGHLLRRLGDLIAEHAEPLARTEVQDNGKLFAEMHLQLRYTPQWYYYYGGLADKIEGSVLPIEKPDTFTFTQYEPLLSLIHI